MTNKKQLEILGYGAGICILSYLVFRKFEFKKVDFQPELIKKGFLLI